GEGGRLPRGAAPTSSVAPSPSSRWKSTRLRLRSNPAYNIATGLPSCFEDARRITPREALLHGSPYHGGCRLRRCEPAAALSRALSCNSVAFSASGTPSSKDPEPPRKASNLSPKPSPNE